MPVGCKHTLHWKDLFDNVDKDEVVLNSCPGGWHRILQAREAKVRGVHLRYQGQPFLHPFAAGKKICTLAGSSPLQSLPVVGHEENELLSSEDSSTSSNNGLLDKDEDDSSSGLERLDSPVEWNRCRQGSSRCLVCRACCRRSGRSSHKIGICTCTLVLRLRKAPFCRPETG